MTAPQCHRARAFSLLELLVTIALLAVLLGSVYAFITTLFDREARALDEAARSQALTMVFDRLESDLMSAIAVTPDGAGLVGRPGSIVVAHRSVLPGSESAPEGDLQSTAVRFDQRAGRLSISRDVGGDANGGAEATPYPVPIREARFRYHDGRVWRDRFDSARSFPAAIELAVWFAEADDGEAELDDPRGSLAGEDANDFGLPFGAERDSAGRPMDRDQFGEFDDRFDDLPEEDEDLPQPDRVRIITIPDARIPRALGRGMGSGGGP